MKSFNKMKLKESKVSYKNGKWVYDNKEEDGLPAFERCVELGWVADKICQVSKTKKLKGQKLFDFGCNKASYIKEFKKKYNLKTYGVDMKSGGRNFVDVFYQGAFNKNSKKSIRPESPFRLVTSISAVEHAGCKWHPNASRITSYQEYILDFLIGISEYFFLSVPFGRRPGWPKDGTRRNLYQFDVNLLDHLKNQASERNKDYLEEIYKYSDDFWIVSNREETQRSRYRNKKQGASAVALVSIFNRK